MLHFFAMDRLKLRLADFFESREVLLLQRRCHAAVHAVVFYRRAGSLSLLDVTKLNLVTGTNSKGRDIRLLPAIFEYAATNTARLKL
jgi:hypothetical protein